MSQEQERRPNQLNAPEVFVRIQHKAELFPGEFDDTIKVNTDYLTPEEIAKQVSSCVEGFTRFKEAIFETIIDEHQVTAVSKPFEYSPTYWIDAKQLSLKEYQESFPDNDWRSIHGESPIVLTRTGRVVRGGGTDVYLSLSPEQK